MTKIVRVAVLCCASATFLSAIPIPTLYNTGVDNAGALLVGGNGIVDPHYSLISGPGIVGTPSAVTFTDPVYLANGPSSRWISGNTSGNPSTGNFVFRTTFDLTGFNLAATSLNFVCGADNRVISVTLNGNATGYGQGNSCDAYINLGLSRLVNTGFVQGLNNLEFTVQNDDDLGPMAFRAQYTSDTTAISSQVPEPGTLLISAAGIAALQLLRLRRRSRAS
jgi:hypothetical protein